MTPTPILIVHRDPVTADWLTGLLNAQAPEVPRAAWRRPQQPGTTAGSQLLLVELAVASADDRRFLIEALREDPKRPVLLTGGDGSIQQVVDAYEAGAAGLIHHARIESELVETVDRLLVSSARNKSQARLLECMQTSHTTFSVENDPTLIPTLLGRFEATARLLGVCDDAEATRLCIAVEEALTNALYHGNLEVSSELRRDGLDKYYNLAARRRQQSPYRSRKIRITEAVSATGLEITIRDDGPGFDVARVGGEPSSENLEAVSGRGLLMMRAFMDEVQFNSTGNQVTLVKHSRNARPTSLAA